MPLNCKQEHFVPDTTLETDLPYNVPNEIFLGDIMKIDGEMYKKLWDVLWRIYRVSSISGITDFEFQFLSKGWFLWAQNYTEDVNWCWFYAQETLTYSE